MINRRGLVALTGSAVLAVPMASRAQGTRKPLVGVLFHSNPEPALGLLRKSLRGARLYRRPDDRSRCAGRRRVGSAPGRNGSRARGAACRSDRRNDDASGHSREGGNQQHTDRNGRRRRCSRLGAGRESGAARRQPHRQFARGRGSRRQDPRASAGSVAQGRPRRHSRQCRRSIPRAADRADRVGQPHRQRRAAGVQDFIA